MPPQNPGQTANVQSDVSGLGDGYVRFNANVLVPENGGPSFNQLLVAPGKDLATSASQPGGITINRNEDFDFNNDGDTIDPIETGNNLFFVGDYTSPPPCFTTGTLIRTPQGEQLIEDLCVGDRVLTYDKGSQEITWIGKTKLRAVGPMKPVCIPACEDGPTQNLWLSQNHRVLKSGAVVDLLFDYPAVLVSAKHLADQSNSPVYKERFVTYVHFQCEAHELVWANGILTETLLASDLTSDLHPTAQASLDEISEIFPEALSAPARPCLAAYEAHILSQAFLKAG